MAGGVNLSRPDLMESLFLSVNSDDPVRFPDKGTLADCHLVPACHTEARLIAAATVLFFTGLIYLPIAEAISIFFIEPMLVTLLSVVILRERIGIRRLSAIAIGFCGAMIIIRPTFSEVGWAVMYPGRHSVVFLLLYSTDPENWSDTKNRSDYSFLPGCSVVW